MSLKSPALKTGRRIEASGVEELGAQGFQASLTICEFCRAEKISRSMLYRAWSEGWGPRFYRVGVTRRITYRARLEWQREREAEAAAEREPQT